jgi:hypothetical protein
MKLNIKSIFSSVISVLFIILLNYILPLPNPLWYLPIFFLLNLSIDSIKDNLFITFKYIIKDKTHKVLFFIFAEILLSLFIIYLDIRIWIHLAVYCSIFWFFSGLMRTCIESTKFVYESNEMEVLDYYRKFGIIRLISLIIGPVLVLALFSNNTIGLTFFFLLFIFLNPITLWSVVFGMRPIFSYLLYKEKTLLEIRIMKILFRKYSTFNFLMKKTKSEENELLITLENLIRRNLIERYKRGYRLSSNVRFNLNIKK